MRVSLDLIEHLFALPTDDVTLVAVDMERSPTGYPVAVFVLEGDNLPGRKYVQGVWEYHPIYRAAPPIFGRFQGGD